MENLPTGWEVKEVGDLGKIYTGKTPSTKDKENFNGDIPFVKPADLDNGGYISKTADYLSEKGLSQIPNLPKNAIMVTCIGNLGKVGISDRVCATNQQINSVVPNELVDYKYLYYYFLTLKEWLQENSSATTVAIINKSKFSKAPIKLPPLPEQRQIAALLDKHLNRIDTIKTQLNAILPIIKTFRQSVLADAVSGKLTKDWRNENGLEFDWEKTTIKDAVSELGLISDGDWVESKDQDENGNIRLIQLADIGDGEFKDKSNRFMNLETAKRLKCTFLKPNDVLIARMPDPLGRACIFPKQNQECVTVVDVCLIRLHEKSTITPEILTHWINSAFLRNEIALNATGTTRKRITRKKLEQLEISIPPLPEQRQIVATVERLFAQADGVEQHIHHALAQVNDMTQSVLHQAFTGQLTAHLRGE